MTGPPIVVLDIGASKIQCLVGEARDDSRLQVLGMGLSPCRGIRRNVVIDMPEMVSAIRAAATEAERSAGLRITGAFAGIAGEGVATHTSRSAVAISGTSDPIDEHDVERAMAAAEEASAEGDGTVLHRFVQTYSVDGEPVQNPLWLHGNRLEVETLSATAPAHVCTTLRRAAEEAGIEIAGFILESVAAAAALLTADEREMGVALVDIGAGTTDLAAFRGTLRHVAEIPFGSEDITKVLSVVLNMSPREAEELKREYGSVCCPPSEADQNVSFHTTAGRPHTIIQHQLSAIIEARQQEILEFVGRELEANCKEHMLAAGIILTGGGALLQNLDQLGEEVLGLPVRIGVPEDISAPESVQSPECATAVGLLRFATDQAGDTPGEGILVPVQTGRSFIDKITGLFSFL